MNDCQHTTAEERCCAEQSKPRASLHASRSQASENETSSKRCLTLLVDQMVIDGLVLCEGMGLGLGLGCGFQWVVWFAGVGGFGFGLGLGSGVARVLLVGQTEPNQ